MQPLYHATLAMSPDQKPTVVVMLPLMNKLKSFYDPKESDNTLERKMRKAIRNNLEIRYNDESVVEYLEEATALYAWLGSSTRYLIVCGTDLLKR